MEPHLTVKRIFSAKPSDQFRMCPQCSGKRLILLAGEAVCTRCDWTSISSQITALEPEGASPMLSPPEAGPQSQDSGPTSEARALFEDEPFIA